MSQELNEVLADVKTEGSDPFADFDKETTSPDSQPEKVEEEVKPDQGDTAKAENTDDENTPFHKRWKAREENLKTELEDKFRSDLEAYKQEVETKLQEVAPKSESPVPEWFQELYGDNQVAWQKYSEHDKNQREEIKKEIVAEQQAQYQQQQAETEHWNKWVDTEIGKLQAEGLRFDRNELIKTMLDYRPTDESNNFDFKAGYKIYEALKGKEINPAHSEARKRIADTATKSSGGEKSAKDYLTGNELRNKSWNQI